MLDRQMCLSDCLEWFHTPICGSPANPEDSLTISRGLAADRPVTPGHHARREILKESFIDVAFRWGCLYKRFFQNLTPDVGNPGLPLGRPQGAPARQPGANS